MPQPKKATPKRYRFENKGLHWTYKHDSQMVRARREAGMSWRKATEIVNLFNARGCEIPLYGPFTLMTIFKQSALSKGALARWLGYHIGILKPETFTSLKLWSFGPRQMLRMKLLAKYGIYPSQDCPVWDLDEIAFSLIQKYFTRGLTVEPWEGM